MSNNLLFSRKRSEELDRLAQDIDPRLVLFCEYTPIEQYLSNESGFILGCLNLYKCTVDGMILWSELRDEDSDLSKLMSPQMSQQLAEIHRQQSFLRAMFAHNNSENVCANQYRRIKNYKDWLVQTVGADTLSTEADFCSALARIKKTGDDLYSILHELLSRIKTLKEAEQEKIINKWITCAAEWYTKNKYNEIYKDLFISHLDIRIDRPNLTTSTAVENLMRNALRRDADEKAWGQIDIPNSSAITLRYKQILQGAGTTEEKQQQVSAFKLKVQTVDKERKNAYDEIDKYDQTTLEIRWKQLLYTQLVARANDPENLTKTGYLGPAIWPDDHVMHYIFPLPLENRPFVFLLKPSK